MIIHVVLPGETLGQIASYYNISIESIIDANDLQNLNQLAVGQSLVIPIEAPDKERPVIDVNAYIYLLEQAEPIIREVGADLTYLCPFTYIIQENGDLRALNDSSSIRTAYEENAAPMMCIANFTTTSMGENLAHVVLSSPAIIQTLLTNILSIMREKGYMGLNIDFENVLPADGELYNQFIQLTVNTLHPEGYFVSSALAPKTGPEQVGLLYEAHDYPAHGRILDFVILMTYEWGYRFASPQAISPLNEIRRVLDYAVTVIPRDKIFFGFLIYARDWLLPHVQGQAAETFSNREALQRAIDHGAIIQYDEIAQSPFYRYTDSEGRLHEVWFEDARSAQAKFDIVKEYGLAGISYWALGYPFPENWILLEDNFTISKII